VGITRAGAAQAARARTHRLLPLADVAERVHVRHPDHVAAQPQDAAPARVSSVSVRLRNPRLRRAVLLARWRAPLAHGLLRVRRRARHHHVAALHLAWRSVRREALRERPGARFSFCWQARRSAASRAPTRAATVAPSPPESGAAEPQAQRSAELAALVRWFETITPASVAELPMYYASDAYFKDPFNEVRGLAPIEGIFSHMFVAMHAPRFVVTGQVLQGNQAFLTWDFHFAFRSFQPDAQRLIVGATHVVFTGVAGGIGPGVQVGDLVVATEFAGALSDACQADQRAREERALQRATSRTTARYAAAAGGPSA
jgi:hypothetical protein